MAGLAALRREAAMSPENSPISGSPASFKRTRRVLGAVNSRPDTEKIQHHQLARVLSDLGNRQQSGDIFSPTRMSPNKAPKREAQEVPVDPIPLFYSRKYCVESAKVSYNFQQNGVEILKKRIADTDPIKASEAVKLAKMAKELIIVNGENVARWAPAALTDAKIKALVVGKHKVLRAPTFICGSTMVVGFSEAIIEEVVFGELPNDDSSSRKSKKAKK